MEKNTTKTTDAPHAKWTASRELRLWKNLSHRLRWRHCLLVLPMLACVAVDVYALPSTSSLEGVLSTASGGTPPDGTYKLITRIYPTSTAKSPVWTDTASNVKVTSGRFHLVIGATTPLAASVLRKLASAYIGVQVGSDPELPRVMLHAVPYALVASEAAQATVAGDLACSGCVSVKELLFDGDLDLKGHGIKAGTINASAITAKSITAGTIAGTAVGLKGVVAAGQACAKGSVLTGFDKNGAPLCAVQGCVLSGVADGQGTIKCSDGSVALATLSRRFKPGLVAIGTGLACGVMQSGTPYCWPDTGPYSGMWGFPPKGDYKKLVVDYDHACGVTTDGKLYCWGGGNAGDKTGYGKSIVPPGSYVDVAVGQQHTCALRADGTLACFGAGTSKTWNSPNLQQSRPPKGVYTSLVCGQWHCCAITKGTGAVTCWGQGKKETSEYADRGQSLPPSGVFKGLALGGYFSCGLHQSGTVTCWGDTYDGAKVTKMPSPSGSFVSVEAGSGGLFACGITQAGGVVCWGATKHAFAPTVPAMKFPGVKYTTLAASSINSCALQAQTIVCQGAMTSRGHWPVMPAPTGKFQRIYGGGQGSMCAHRVGGSLVCWGDYNKGGFYTP